VVDDNVGGTDAGLDMFSAGGFWMICLLCLCCVVLCFMSFVAPTLVTKLTVNL